MPRNTSGDYVLPAGNPVLPNTLIETSWCNPTMGDIAAALTDSLSRSAKGGMLDSFKVVDGVVSAPGLAFAAESNTGLYRPASKSLGISVFGVEAARFTDTGIEFKKPLTIDKLFLGTSTGYPTSNAIISRISMHGVGTALASMTLANWESGASGASVYQLKAKSGTVGTHAAVVLNDTLGGNFFEGSDGVAFFRGAGMLAAVDGAVAAGSVPARLVFQTTAVGAGTPTERMRIAANGNVCIGPVTSLTDRRLNVSGNIAGSVNAYGILNTAVVQSDVTSSCRGITSAVGTAVASFTLADLMHFRAQQGTIGAGSAITNQYGYYADSSLVGATSNYGFYSAIPSGANRFNFYGAGTADSYLQGNLGLGTTPASKLHVAGQTRLAQEGSTLLLGGTTTTTLEFWRTGFGATRTGYVGHGSANGQMHIAADGGDILLFAPTERARVMASGGALCVNATSNSAIGSGVDKVAVAGSIGLTGNLYATPGAAQPFDIIAGSANSFLRFWTNLGGTHAMDILANGVIQDGSGTELGWKDLPGNVQAGPSYTLVASDRAKGVICNFAGTVNVPGVSAGIPVYSVIVVYANAGTVTLSPSGTTMKLDGPGTLGARTVALSGRAVLWQYAPDVWSVSGPGVT